MTKAGASAAMSYLPSRLFQFFLNDLVCLAPFSTIIKQAETRTIFDASVRSAAHTLMVARDPLHMRRRYGVCRRS